MAILKGYLGGSANLPATGVPITLIDCVAEDLFHRDPQGKYLEDPVQAVIHFTAANAPVFGFPVRVEWGAHGGSSSIEIIAYPGLSLPLKGSFFRVSVLPYAGFAGVLIAVGAFIGQGTCEAPIIPLVGPTAIAAGAVGQLDFNTAWLLSGGIPCVLNTLSGYVKEFKVYRNPVAVALNIGTGVGAPFDWFSVDVGGGTDSPWVAAGGLLLPLPSVANANITSRSISVTNLGAVACTVSVFGKLSL